MAERTLTKEWLKKAFLKTLWESTQPGGTLTGTSHGVDNILHRYTSTLAQLFQLKNTDHHVTSQWSLTEEEWRLARQGVEELQQDRFIMNDPTQNNDNFKVLTEKGLRVAANDLADMKLSSVDIENILSRDDLLNRVRSDFLNEGYESAIFKAYKQVEEAVRAKAGQAAAITGHDLMVAAFNPNRGALRNPEAKTPAEDHAFFLLFDCAHSWFRNPVGHRTVPYQDAKEAAQIIGLANLLLDMLDRCVVR